VHAYWGGRLPESIVADYPTLTLEKVYGAIAFYLVRRKEIDDYLSAQDSRWRQLQAESFAKNGPLLQRARVAAGGLRSDLRFRKSSL
jgi:hypothetical protein